MNAGVLNDLSSSGEVRNTADDAMEQRWLLQKNVHVSSIRRTHDVVWYHGDVIDEALASSRGCGSGRGFVEALVAGDRVAVVARAQASQNVQKLHNVGVYLISLLLSILVGLTMCGASKSRFST